jgi:hypothetical protein
MVDPRRPQSAARNVVQNAAAPRGIRSFANRPAVLILLGAGLAVALLVAIHNSRTAILAGAPATVPDNALSGARNKDGPRSIAPTSAAMIEGRVLDGERPLAGARVRRQGARAFVLSDRRGRFRLAAEEVPRTQAAAQDHRPADGSAFNMPWTITAAKAGYFIGATRRDAEPLVIRLVRLPEFDDAGYPWVDPTPDAASSQNCGNCHESIYNEWQSSGHAGGTANRHFMNLYAGTDWHGRPERGWSLLGEHAEGAGVCGSCHTPAADLDNPRFDDLRNLRGAAAGGVQCDFCHKIQDVAIEHVGLQHGRFAMSLVRPAVEQIFFGPLDDVSRGEDVYSPLQTESRYCAACHEGIVFGVPVYSTYSEWLASPARAQGKQCQTCHMAPSGELHNIAPGAGGLEREPHTLASHDMLPGGRAAMLRRALDMTAKLSPAAGKGGRAAILEVTLSAHDVGHRVPTGFVDRHLILSVEARDAAGRVVELVAGPRLPTPAGGQLAGRPGVLFAKLLTDTAGSSPAPFWRAGLEVSDTRLVVGQPRESRYTLPHGAVSVEVRVIYRRFWEVVAREKDWPADDIVVTQNVYSLTDGTLRSATP